MKDYQKQQLENTNDFLIKQGIDTPIDALSDMWSCTVSSDHFGELSGEWRTSILHTYNNLLKWLNDAREYKDREWERKKKKAIK